MVVIRVNNKKDTPKVFSILLKNGRFSGLSDNRFVIEENGENTVKQIKKEKLDITIL